MLSFQKGTMGGGGETQGYLLEGSLGPGLGDRLKAWSGTGPGSEEAPPLLQQCPRLRGAIAYPNSSPWGLIRGSGEPEEGCPAPMNRGTDGCLNLCG